MPDGFREFATDVSGALFRSAWLLTGDWHLAEDLVQDTLARMYRIWSSIERIDNPAAYAQVVLARQFLSYRRRRSSAERPSAALPDVPGAAPDTDLRLDLVGALLKLPKRDRAVVVLRYLADRSVEQVAADLGRTPSAIKVQSMRALAKLRESLGRTSSRNPERHLMDDDDRISSVFHGAVATIDPPVERLVAGGIARGRRRLRLVRGVEVLSVVAIVVAVGALVVALIPGSATHHVPVATGHGRAAATPPTPTTSAAPPATVTMTPQALLQTALDTLPRAGTTSRYAGNFDGNGFVGAQFVYDDGDGASQILVSMQYPPQQTAAHPPEPIVGCRPSAQDCTVLPDGAHARASEGLEYPYQHDPNATERSVDLVRPDGVKVSFSEWNAPQEKDAAISRPEPPFTLNELIAWADSPNWQVRIPQQRADASAGLFRPVDLREPDQGQPPTPKQQRAVEHRNCRSARLTHKPLPSYCVGG